MKESFIGIIDEFYLINSGADVNFEKQNSEGQYADNFAIDCCYCQKRVIG